MEVGRSPARTRNSTTTNNNNSKPQQRQLTLQDAINRAYHNMCLLLKKEDANVAVPEDFRLFLEEDMIRHFLYDVVIFSHEMVKLLDNEEECALLFKDLVPGVHELERQQRIADKLGSSSKSRLTKLATTYSQLLLTCSNFEHTIEDLNFFECLYLFTIEVIKMHMRRREFWKPIRQQMAWLLCGPTRSLVEFGKDDFDARQEAQAKQAKQVMQPRTLDDFIITMDEDDAGANDLGDAKIGKQFSELSSSAAMHAKFKSHRKGLPVTSAGLSPTSLDATGFAALIGSPGPPELKPTKDLPTVAGLGGGGYFYKDSNQIEVLREAANRKKVWEQSQGGMLKNTLARRAARRRAEKGSGPKSMARNMVQAIKTIENSQKICEEVLQNKAKVKAERARLSPRPRVELTLDKAQNFGTPLIAKLTPRVQPALVAPTEPTDPLAPTLPADDKPRSSRLTPRQQRVVDGYERSRKKGLLAVQDDDGDDGETVAVKSPVSQHSRQAHRGSMIPVVRGKG
jgi:hypothetical protein